MAATGVPANAVVVECGGDWCHAVFVKVNPQQHLVLPAAGAAGRSAPNNSLMPESSLENAGLVHLVDDSAEASSDSSAPWTLDAAVPRNAC